LKWEEGTNDGASDTPGQTGKGMDRQKISKDPSKKPSIGRDHPFGKNRDRGVKDGVRNRLFFLGGGGGGCSEIRGSFEY